MITYYFLVFFQKILEITGLLGYISNCKHNKVIYSDSRCALVLFFPFGKNLNITQRGRSVGQTKSLGEFHIYSWILNLVLMNSRFHISIAVARFSKVDPWNRISEIL